MTRYARALLIILFAGSLFAQNQPADLVLKNANIYTVDEQKPHAQAAAVKGDKIVFVGSTADTRRVSTCWREMRQAFG